MIFDIKKILRGIRYALQGLRHAYRDDTSFRMEILWGIPAYAVSAYVLVPLEPLEWCFFLMSYVLILIVELINTSIEKLLERLHPEQHELIGHSKDIASAAVLLSFIFAALVLGILFFRS